MSPGYWVGLQSQVFVEGMMGLRTVRTNNYEGMSLSVGGRRNFLTRRSACAWEG